MTGDLVDELMVTREADNLFVDVFVDIELEASKQTFDKGSSCLLMKMLMMTLFYLIYN